MDIKTYRKIGKSEKIGSLVIGILLAGLSIYGYFKYESWFVTILLFLAGLLISTKFFSKKEYDEELIPNIDKYEVVGAISKNYEIDKNTLPKEGAIKPLKKKEK
jgi:hypothetical protein